MNIVYDSFFDKIYQHLPFLGFSVQIFFYPTIYIIHNQKRHSKSKKKIKIYTVSQMYTLLINQNIVFYLWNMRKNTFQNLNLYISLTSRDIDMKISDNTRLGKKD